MNLSIFRSRLQEYLGLHGIKPNSAGLTTCPLSHHLNDSHPSFSVANEVWHCFGCGEGGDIFTFASLYHGLPARGEQGFTEVTLTHLADQLGIIYRPPKRVQDKYKDRMAYYSILRHITNQLTLRPAKKFINGRGWSMDVAKRFGIGVLTNPRAVISTLKREYSEDFLKTIGLLYDNGAVNTGILSSKKIIFPICNQYGATVALNARTLADPDPGEPKYINSRGNSFFKKGDIIYNFHRVRRRTKEVYVVEGPTDVITLAEAGVDNVVALSGTAFSPVQAKLLSTMDKVTFVLDGDSAGKKSMETALKQLPNAYVKLIPDQMDPDQLVREHGLTAFTDLEFLTPVEYMIETSDYSHPRDVAKKWVDVIWKEDPLDHSTLIKRLSRHSGIDPQLIAESVARRLNKSALKILEQITQKTKGIHITILPQQWGVKLPTLKQEDSNVNP